tara:strand:+ start:139 stop:456 length:318 start_codon:yes stop_codon:yes gene_type:complete
MKKGLDYLRNSFIMVAGLVELLSPIISHYDMQNKSSLTTESLKKPITQRETCYLYKSDLDSNGTLESTLQLKTNSGAQNFLIEARADGKYVLTPYHIKDGKIIRD